jgi:hypothetical protein
MFSLSDDAEGLVVPRVAVRPSGVVRSSGPDAVELAAECGMVLDPWQAEELYWSLAERDDGVWAALDYLLICARQNGKNVILETRELYGLVVLGERILHTAHEFKTAKESFEALETMLEANKSVLRQRTDRHASIATGYDMTFRSGGKIQYLARTRSSGRGFRGIDLLVMDEVQDMNNDHQGALGPTISSKANAQSWYQGSAPEVRSEVLHRLRKQLRSGVGGTLGGAEFSADPDADLDDRVQWRQANPNLRVTIETIARERIAYSDEDFACERLSISPDPLEAGGPFGPAWAACCDPKVTIEKPTVFGLDVNPDRTGAGIVGVCADPALVSVAEYRPGVDWVVGRCAELRDRYKVAFAVDKGGPAGSLVEDLRRARVRVVELDGRSMAKAYGTFWDAVNDKQVGVRTDEDLDKAVAGAERRSVGDSWTWGRKSSRADITLLVAATVGYWAALNDRPPELFIY